MITIPARNLLRRDFLDSRIFQHRESIKQFDRQFHLNFTYGSESYEFISTLNSIEQFDHITRTNFFVRVPIETGQKCN